MSVIESAVSNVQIRRSPEPIFNDFNVQVATVNGSGSQTANTVLLRSLFQMGIPVSGKNLFPSNIAGLPTWFSIRVSKDGYVARRENVDILVAMNSESAREDVTMLAPDSMVVYDEPLNLRSIRQDLFFYPVPFDRLVVPVCPDAKLRRLVKNMIYPGVLARLLGIEMPEVERSLRKQFKKKPKAADLNLKAAQLVGKLISETRLREQYDINVLGLMLTQPLSNAAAPLLVLPTAINTATLLQANPRTFAMMVSVAASISLITPFEPACLLVYGPGKYQFLDFVKNGALITFLAFGVCLALIPLYWPL